MAGVTAQMTIVLLNFRRPRNIPLILESIQRQTIKPIVFLWNNGSDDVNFSGIDRYVASPGNVGCMARWKMALEAETPYVMSLDDDLCFARNDALATVIASLESMDDPARIVGPVGCRFGATPDYGGRDDVYAGFAQSEEVETDLPRSSELREADMIKGRSMALRRDRLEKLNFVDEREDDIFISGALANGERGVHRVPSQLRNAFRELPEYGTANWRQPEHLRSRIRATALYFGADWRPHRQGEIVEHDGEAILLELDNGDGVELNESGALIWGAQ